MTRPPEPERLAQRDLFLRLHAEGLTDQQLARALGVKLPAIYRRRRREGLPANRGQRCRPSVDVARKPRRNEAEPDPEALGEAERTAWLREIDRFRTRHGRYPSLREAFRLALGMGYRRVE